jgi:hypothetical protein
MALFNGSIHTERLLQHEVSSFLADRLATLEVAPGGNLSAVSKENPGIAGAWWADAGDTHHTETRRFRALQYAS